MTSSGWTLEAELAVWPDHWLEVWRERTAIMEYDGKLSREDADLAAWKEVLANPPPWQYPVQWNEEWLHSREQFRLRLKTYPRWVQTFDLDKENLEPKVQKFLEAIPTNQEAWVRLAAGMMELWGELNLHLVRDAKGHVGLII